MPTWTSRCRWSSSPRSNGTGRSRSKATAASMSRCNEARESVDIRTPPHSLEAEQAVLGGLLLDAAAWFNVSDVVRAEDFYRPDHRTIFDAIRALASNQKPTDAVTVAEHLERNGLAADVGGLAYLGTLAR